MKSLLVILLISAVLLVGCGGAQESTVPTSAQDDKVEQYIADVDAILNEATGMALEATGMNKIVNQLDKAKITQIFTDYNRD